MRAHHLKKIGEIWYYQRRRPKAFEDVEIRSLIRFSLKTRDYSIARAMAAKKSLALEQEWQAALSRIFSLNSIITSERYRGAIKTNDQFCLPCKNSQQIDDEELLTRLRLLLKVGCAQSEQKAILGLVSRPEISLDLGFDRFWKYIKDERLSLSRDQQRVKKNSFLKAIKNFNSVVGLVSVHKITRDHAIQFRSWWVDRIEKEVLQACTANREIGCLRRLISVNFDIDGIERINPFYRVKIKDTKRRQREPFTSHFINSVLLKLDGLDGLPNELITLVHMLVNTGARPSELIGMELEDLNLNAEIPFIHIRKNGVRSLKTEHSERNIPLVGVSLIAAQNLVENGGWGKWLGKNMYATTVINRFFREKKLVTSQNKSLYSLRHWFQDQLTKHDVIDRAQAQLMGHKFSRPKYGFGKDLAELRIIIEKFAI